MEALEVRSHHVFTGIQAAACELGLHALGVPWLDAVGDVVDDARHRRTRRLTSRYRWRRPPSGRREFLMMIFHIPPNSTQADAELEESFESAAEQDMPELISYMLQLACTADLKEDPAHPGDAPIIEELRDLSNCDLETIQAEVQDEMKAEAAKRAGKPACKPTGSKGAAKVKQQDASAAIAKAMQAADGTSPNDFQELQKVRILKNLSFAGALLPTKDRIAVLVERMGDRAWWLELPKRAEVDLDDMGQLDPGSTWEITADYTEIQAIDEGEAQHA